MQGLQDREMLCVANRRMRHRESLSGNQWSGEIELLTPKEFTQMAL
jgi:hypothetical protein